MNKRTLATVITAILALWQILLPTVEIILGAGSRELLIISGIITVISYVYNFLYPKESIFKTIANRVRHVGTRPARPPRR